MSGQREESKLQHIADETHFHGIKELYYSNKLWKCIWILLIAGSIAITTYQLVQLARQVSDQPTTTTVSMLLEGAEYPPLELCYISWFCWVDCVKAENLGLDKASLFYAISHIRRIYSEITLDIPGAKSNLAFVMKKHNFTTFLQLFQAISFDSPQGYTFEEDVRIQHWEKYMNPDWSAFCYSINGSQIKNALASRKSIVSSAMKNTISMTYMSECRNISKCPMVTYDERKLSALDVVFQAGFQYQGLDVSRINFSAAVPFVRVEGPKGSDIYIMAGIFQLEARLNVAKMVWLPRSKCVENDVAKRPQFSCEDTCRWKVETNKEKGCLNMLAASLFGLDTPDRTCTNPMVFFKETAADPTNITSVGEIPSDDAAIAKCIANECVEPCTVWKYSMNLISTPTTSEIFNLEVAMSIKVKYPESSEILVTTEVVLQTWENIVGSVGGIIGLWLGASLLSIPQLIFLATKHAFQKRRTIKVFNPK